MAAVLAADRSDSPLPVEKWHPEREGKMDLVIKRDGAWIHEGEPIERPAIVRLFSRILRRDTDGYVLVTPAEKLSITVEDVPFLIVGLEDGDDGALVARTNLGERVSIDDDHPISLGDFEGAKVPYLRVRGDLLARFSRNAYYELVDRAEETADGHLRVSVGKTAFDLGVVE